MQWQGWDETGLLTQGHCTIWQFTTVLLSDHLCDSTQFSTALTTSSLPWVGAHMLVQCITIDIFLPPTPCLMKVPSSHVTRNKHAVRRISKFYKLGDLTGNVLQWVSDKIISLCSPHREGTKARFVSTVRKCMKGTQ